MVGDGLLEQLSDNIHMKHILLDIMYIKISHQYLLITHLLEKSEENLVTFPSDQHFDSDEMPLSDMSLALGSAEWSRLYI